MSPGQRRHGRKSIEPAKWRLSRAESRLNAGSKSSIEASVSQCADLTSTGLDIEATLAGEIQFHGGAGRSAGKPKGGTGRVVYHDSVSGRKTGTVAPVLKVPDRRGVF